MFPELYRMMAELHKEVEQFRYKFLCFTVDGNEIRKIYTDINFYKKTKAAAGKVQKPTVYEVSFIDEKL